MDKPVPQGLPRAASRHSVQMAAVISTDLETLDPQGHEALHRELDLLQLTLSSALASDPQSRLLRDLHLRLGALHQAVLEHMEREDQLLFPWLRCGRLAEMRAPVRGMRLEHQSFSEELDRVAGYLATAAPTLLALERGADLLACIDRFDGFLRRHMAAEDSLVYARVLADDATEQAAEGQVVRPLVEPSPLGRTAQK